MSTYEKALDIAINAHKGQTRWDGTDYINHPIAVANNFSFPLLKIVAILHDTIEDHPDKVSEESLRSDGFAEDIIEAVKLLTRNKSIDYLSYILPIKRNYLAKTVKIADLKHNLSCFPQNKRNGSMYDKYNLALYILEQ